MSAFQASALTSDQDEDIAVNDVLGRVETMLNPASGGSFATAENPVLAAMRAAARFYGRKPEAGLTPGSSEAHTDIIERLARSAGLVAHHISLSPGWERRYALPMMARRASDGVPVALIPQGTKWKIVPGDKPCGARILDKAGLADLGEDAFALSPVLPDTKINWKGLLAYGLRTKIRDLSGFAAMTFIAGLALALVPMANMVVTDIIIPGRETTLLGHVVMMLIALVFASLATRLAAELSMLRINGRTGLMLRVASADRMIRVTRAGTGQPIPPAAAALVTRCLESWHRGAWGIILSIAAAFLIALPSLAVMLRIAPGAGLGAIGIIAAAAGFAAYTAKSQINTLFSGAASPTSWISLSYEALSQVETLRAHGAEKRFFKLFAESFLGLKEKFLTTDRMGARIHALERALEAIVIGVGIGIAIVMYRSMPVQHSVAFTVALMTVTGAAVTLIHSFLEVAMLGLQYRMSLPLMEGTPAPYQTGGRPPELSGAISVENIVVSKDKNARPILDRVSLTIAAGEHVGIVGPSGSGKSTLLRAILGLEPLDAGRVCYDGMPLEVLDAAAVRRQVGVVGQSGQLFPGTILDNISLGLLLDEKEAWDALALAAVDDEVRALPLGLSTPIGDAGSVFSGGQTQRLLLARALAHRPRIIVLDEATSALDPEREARVAAAIDGLQATTISVAHRLDTVRRCDRIFVLDQGRIVETGSYDELVAAGGTFAALVEADSRAAEHRPNKPHEAIQLLQAEFNAV